MPFLTCSLCPSGILNQKWTLSSVAVVWRFDPSHSKVPNTASSPRGIHTHMSTAAPSIVLKGSQAATCRRSAFCVFLQLCSMKAKQTPTQWILSYFPKGKLKVRTHCASGHCFLAVLQVILFGMYFWSDALFNTHCWINTELTPQQASSWLCDDAFPPNMAPFQPCWVQWHQAAHQRCVWPFWTGILPRKA